MWYLATQKGRYEAVAWLSRDCRRELHSRAERLLVLKLDDFPQEEEAYRREYIEFVVAFALGAILVDESIAIVASTHKQQKILLKEYAARALDIASLHAVALEEALDFRGGFGVATQSLLKAFDDPNLVESMREELIDRAEASRIMSEYDETGDYEEIVKRRLGPNPDGNERKKLLQTLHQTVRRERNTRKIDNLAHFDVPDLKDPSLSRPVLSPGDRKIVSALWKTDNWHRMCCAQARCGMSLNDLRNNAGDLLDRVEEYFRQFVRVKTRSGGQLVRPKVWDLLDSLRYQEDREAVLTRAHPKIGSQPMSQDQYELIHYLFRGVSAGVDPDYLGRTCQHCDRYHHIVRIVTAEKKAEYYLDKTHDV